MRFIEDPAHGWLEVERTELFRLNIQDKITEYSYQNGSKVYLEEDCDLTTFAKALEKETGVPMAEWFKTVPNVYQENTPIRYYGSFRK